MLIIISQVVITSNYPLYGTGFWGGNPANNYGFGNSNISANIENMQNNITPISQATAMTQQQNPLQQIFGAMRDMVGNYIDMKNDNTIGGDDYFHCKANYEAAQRGDYGALTAQILGNAKEDLDFWDNQLRKGLSYMAAYQDKIHDRTINQIGRQRAQKKLYRNSREACYPYRVEGINEKY